MRKVEKGGLKNKQTVFLFLPPLYPLGFPDGSAGKNMPANAGDMVWSWVGKIPWRREWKPTPVFLPWKSHRERNLVGYSLWGRKESDTTEWLNNNNHYQPSCKACPEFLPLLSKHVISCRMSIRGGSLHSLNNFSYN